MRSINDLTLADNMLFCSVMEKRPDLAKELLEMILNKKIEDIKIINKEKTIDTFPNSKSIRLDVYVKGEDEVYDIEMQTYRKKNLSKRSRYYHSALDMDIIQKGENYSSLKPTYIIFICSFDPFNIGRQIYKFEQISVEENDIIYLKDEDYRIFVNAEAFSDNEKLNRFLNFLKTNMPTDEYTEKLYEEITDLKKDSVWRKRHMFIWDYMEETEEEVLAKGETIGEVKGSIRTYLKFCSKDETIKNVMNEFHLSREEVLKIIDSFNNK